MAKEGSRNPLVAEFFESRWSRLDTAVLILLSVVGGVLRAARATTPPGGVFDEGFYVQEGCLLAAPGACPPDAEFGSAHPPLGAWLVGLGIRVFGYRSGGWRAASLVAGTLTIALLYLLARKLLRSTLGATLAAALLAFEFLHFVHSRTAMIDVFVTLFAVGAVLFAVYDGTQPARDPPRALMRRPWRLAAGLAAGAAVATKWSGIPILVGVVALALAFEVQRRRDAGARRALSGALRAEGTSVALLFIVLPGLVYVVSHVGRIDGAVLALPWSDGSWMRAFLERQGEMLNLHARLGPLGQENPYTSPAWSWPVLQRPISYFFEVAGGRYRQVLAVGNPLIWWGSLAALGAVGARWIRSRRLDGPEAVILTGFLVTWGAWLLLVPTRSYMFLFYLLPAVPFMCLALAYAVVALPRARARVPSAAALTAAAAALFALSYPVLAAVPVSPEAWERRIVFGYEACGIERPAPGEPPHQAFLEDRTPPTGWCWI